MDPVRGALVRAEKGGLIPHGSRLLLAVSGGADSMALLCGAVEAAAETGWEISVGHVHHGWRGREADRDLAFVSDYTRRLGLPFLARRADARLASRQLGLSPEAGARHVRYSALLEMARKAGAILIATAHQQNDAVESHLIALERRGGLALLAGPREKREDGVVRPLLLVTRGEILRFLATRGIPYRRDASNGDLRLARNRIRRGLAARPDGAAVREIAQRIARLALERRRLEEEFIRLLAPSIWTSAEQAGAEAVILEGCSAELQRLALEKLAAPFARSGRPPMTGREREQILHLLGSGTDFRFEAGRRIRFERRGRTLRVTPRPRQAAPPVYDAEVQTSTRAESREIAS